MSLTNYKTRSFEPELLDQENIPAHLLRLNMRELANVNRLLNGHSITIDGIEKLLQPGKKEYSIMDIGCGGGDTLHALSNWSKKKNIKLHLTGIDINPEIIKIARENCYLHPEVNFIVKNYQEVDLSKSKPDIIISSLFCHHLNDSQLGSFIQWMNKNSKIGFVINDLQRNRIARNSIWLLSRILNSSVLFKNDAPLSVEKAFFKNELMEMMQQSGISNYEIEWKWAFRYLVTATK